MGLLKKIGRRLFSSFVKVVPFRSFERPIGTLQSFFELEKGKNATMVESFYPEMWSEIRIKKDLEVRWTRKLRNKLLLKTSLHPQRIAGLSQGRIFTNNIDTIAFIDNQSKVVSDISFQFANDKPCFDASANKVFDIKYYKRPTYIDGTVFSFLSGGGAIHNYFHWLYDVLPRYHLLQKSKKAESVDYFLVPSKQKQFQKDSLAALNIQENQLIEAGNYTYLKAKELIGTTHPRSCTQIPQWTIDFLRAEFCSKESVVSYPKMIYLSREDASYRNIINETELKEMLQSYGIESIVLKDFSFQDQVNLFANAEFIVAPHGASLANLAFCNEKAMVLEFFSEDYIYPLYNHIATLVGIDYNFVIFKEFQRYRNFLTKSMKKDIRVDLKKMQIKVEKLLLKRENALVSSIA